MGCCGSSATSSAAPAVVVEEQPSARVPITVNDFLGEVRRTELGGAQSSGGEGENSSLDRGQLDHQQLLRSYARYLGLDPTGQPELLWIAEHALRAPVPAGWTEHFDSQGRVFYYDQERKESSWIHPLEQDHRDMHQRITDALGIDSSQLIASLQDDIRRLESESEDEIWTEHTDDEGHTFFFNSHRRCSSWTDPRPAMRHRLSLHQQALDWLSAQKPDALLYEQESDRPSWIEVGALSPPDPWLSPRLLLPERAAECPVCYEPLYSAQPSVLVQSTGKRLCGHYFCLQCAQRLRNRCPLCRAEAVGGCHAQALPDVEKAPRLWFRMVDINGSGCLEQKEVIRALEAVLPLDPERLWKALGITGDAKDSDDGAPPPQCCVTELGWWKEWRGCEGEGGSIGIGTEAFCAEGGMLQWIVEHLRDLRRAEVAGEPPRLDQENLETWFEYWASDSGCGLSRPELLRALMKTLKVSGEERRRVREIRSTIEYCFHAWAPEGGDHVTMEAFLLKPDGLGPQLLALLFPNAPHDESESDTGCGAGRRGSSWRPLSPDTFPPELGVGKDPPTAKELGVANVGVEEIELIDAPQPWRGPGVGSESSTHVFASRRSQSFVSLWTKLAELRKASDRKEPPPGITRL